jgi:hypothetical protein
MIEASEVVVPCEPALALKVVQGAREYAGKLGFKPDPDYFYAREIFGTIDAESCDETIEYGDEGKPLYILGPYDDAERVLARLRRTLGTDGFHVVVPLDLSDSREDGAFCRPNGGMRIS